MAMKRTNERSLCWIALALFYLSFSAPITSAHSHHEYNAVSQKRGADRSDYGKTRTIQRNDPPDENISPSSSEATIAVEENRRNINTSTRVRSNQHGLISVSVLVEIEEHTIMPVALSPGKNDNRYNKKDRDGRAQVLHTFDEHNSSIASPRNNIDIIWTVSVEEIQVGGRHVQKDESKPTLKPYSQLVLLEWKKRKEVNEYVEYVTASSHDTDIKNGFTNTNAVASKRLYQNSVHFSGTANCTFMIPLERDDSSFHSSPSLTKTFIVSLMQSTRLAASMTSTSLYDDIRSNNNSHERNTTTVLTRRLATLPRKTYSHHQSIIDPVAKITLHHSQRQMYHEEPQLPGYTLSEDYDFNSRCEKQPTDDDNINDNKSGYASRNNLRDLFSGESSFLWTLLLLSTVHGMRSIPIGYILILDFCLKYLQSLGCAMLPVHTQEYDGEDYIDNTHHHDDGKAEEDVDNEACHYLEVDHRCNPRFEEGAEKLNQVQTISHLPSAPSYSDKDAKMIRVETSTCFSKDPRQKDHPKNFKNHDGYNTTFCCGDCDDDNNNAEKEEGKKAGPGDNNLDHILDNPLIVHEEEAHLQDDIVRLRPNMESTAINSDMSTFNDNLIEVSNPKFENVNTSFGSSHKSAILPTVSHPKNYTNSLKSAVAATIGPSSRNNPLSQISNNLMNNSEEMKCINIKDTQERSVKTIEPKTYSDPPFKDSPVGTSYIVNCTNEKEDSDYSSPKEPPREDHWFGSLGSKTQLDDAQRSSSEETPKSGCNKITEQIYKNPTKDLFEVMHENSDAKVKIVPPLGLSSEKLLMADKRMKSVNSTRTPNNSYTGPLHEGDILFDNLPTKECPAMNLLTGTGTMRRLSITHTKDSILGVDQDTQCGDVLDQTVETHDLKERFIKSSMQVENAPQFSKKSVGFIERGTCNHTIIGYHLDTALNHTMRKDQNQDSIILPVGGHGNAENSFSKKTNEVKGYPIHSFEDSMEGPSRRRKETTATGAISSKFDSPSSLPPRGQGILTQFSDLEHHEIHQARLGQSNQDLAESEIKFNDGLLGSPTANITVNPPKSSGLRVGNLKQIQSLSEYKKSELQKKHEIRNGNVRWKRNIGQGSEAEESYVSTLPPDSDYVSDDDHSLLFLGRSTSESQAFESQSIANSCENERKKREISNDARFGKRRKRSRHNGPPDKAALTRDATLTVINLEPLQKESSKDTDLDSVEVVRVIIPDKLKKRGKRPYRKSNYVADWVPSNELQSMSQAFLHEESWDMVTPDLQTSTNTRVPKAISLQSKKSKDGFQSSHKSRCL